MDSAQLLELILKNLNEGVLVVNAQANITFLNEPSAQITGLERDGLIGKNILTVFPSLTEKSSSFYNVLKTGNPMIEQVQTYTNSKNQTVTIVSSTLPIFESGQLVGAVEIFRAMENVQRLMTKINTLQSELNALYKKQKDFRDNGTLFTIDNLIGNSPSIQKIKKNLVKISQNHAPVLVVGETGTGKELVVQSIHNGSDTRRKYPFIAQNCAAIPSALLESLVFGTSSGSFTGAKDMPGLFELAHGGTLFLDEITAMDFDLQAKLLRVIQDGIIRRIGSSKTIQVDVRIIAACNIEPHHAVSQKLLRPDLYYRLSGIELNLAPLRERTEDIPILIRSFLDQASTEQNDRPILIEDDVMLALMRYTWPGNIRQLKSVVDHMRLFAHSETITLLDLPERLKELVPSHMIQDASDPIVTNLEPPHHSQHLSSDSATMSLKEQVKAYEQTLINQALKAANGNITKAAKSLALPVQTLHSKLQRK